VTPQTQLIQSTHSTHNWRGTIGKEGMSISDPHARELNGVRHEGTWGCVGTETRTGPSFRLGGAMACSRSMSAGIMGNSRRTPGRATQPHSSAGQLNARGTVVARTVGSCRRLTRGNLEKGKDFGSLGPERDATGGAPGLQSFRSKINFCNSKHITMNLVLI
jgi:hypothetical protein